MNESINELLVELKGKYDIFDPFHIIEKEGISLKYVPFPDEVLGR